MMWRSVDDFLPLREDGDASDDVLVLLEDNTMDVCFYDFVRCEWQDRSGFDVPPSSNKITHWRTLPPGPGKE